MLALARQQVSHDVLCANDVVCCRHQEPPTRRLTGSSECSSMTAPPQHASGRI